MEHSIGSKTLRGDIDIRERVGLDIHKRGIAYLEEKPFHRAHIGTGNKGIRFKKRTGWTSDTYRSDQAEALEEIRPGNAVQLNQLGYSFVDDFQGQTNSSSERVADDSFHEMVDGGTSVTFNSNGEIKTLKFTQREQAEMTLSRQAARTGSFPTIEEENLVRSKFGLPTIDEEIIEPSSEEIAIVLI